MSTVFRKPAVPVPPQPLARPKSKPGLRSVLSSTVWQRERIDLPDRYLAIPLYVAVAGFLAVLVYSTTAPGPVDGGQGGSVLACQYAERGGKAIGSCQERR
jgi:hypothetical protein